MLKVIDYLTRKHNVILAGIIQAVVPKVLGEKIQKVIPF